MTSPRLRTRSARVFQFGVGGIDRNVRVEQKHIDAVKLSTVDFRGGGQVEHGSSGIGGSLPSPPLPTTPGQAAL